MAYEVVKRGLRRRKWRGWRCFHAATFWYLSCHKGHLQALSCFFVSEPLPTPSVGDVEAALTTCSERVLNGLSWSRSGRRGCYYCINFTGSKQSLATGHKVRFLVLYELEECLFVGAGEPALHSLVETVEVSLGLLYLVLYKRLCLLLHALWTALKPGTDKSVE